MVSRRRVVDAAPRKQASRLHAVRVVLEPDTEADVSYLDQEGFETRRAAYKRGGFTLVFARAEADVEIAGLVQTLLGGGIGGIESDTDQDALVEIASEEWRSLRDVLKAVGIPTAELPLEIDPAWIEWRT